MAHSKSPEPTSTEVVSAKVQEAYASARDKATTAAGGAASIVQGNPLAALLGGIAIGAAAGALLPRSEREKALLAPLGSRFTDAIQAALAAGREAGMNALSDSGLTVDGLREQASTLFSQAAAAAGQAGTAALGAARDTARG